MTMLSPRALAARENYLEAKYGHFFDGEVLALRLGVEKALAVLDAYAGIEVGVDRGTLMTLEHDLDDEVERRSIEPPGD